MHSPQHVAEFLTWIDWLIQLAIVLGLLPHQIAAVLMLPEVLAGIGQAIGQAVASFVLAFMVGALIVVCVGGLLFFAFAALVVVIVCPNSEQL